MRRGSTCLSSTLVKQQVDFPNFIFGCPFKLQMSFRHKNRKNSGSRIQILVFSWEDLFIVVLSLSNGWLRSCLIPLGSAIFGMDIVDEGQKYYLVISLYWSATLLLTFWFSLSREPVSSVSLIFVQVLLASPNTILVMEVFFFTKIGQHHSSTHPCSKEGYSSSDLRDGIKLEIGRWGRWIWIHGMAKSCLGRLIFQRWCWASIFKTLPWTPSLWVISTSLAS